MPASRQTLEQHMAQLRQQDAALNGSDVQTPFPATCDFDHYNVRGWHCWVTSVGERTAVVLDRFMDPAEMVQDSRGSINQRCIRVDPADVKLIDRSAKRGSIVDGQAAARGRKASLAGKGVRARQAAERAREASNAG